MEKSEEPTGLLRSEVTILLPVRHEQHDHLPGTSKIAFQLFIVVGRPPFGILVFEGTKSRLCVGSHHTALKKYRKYATV